MLNEILHYQELDGKIKSLEQELLQMPERIKATEMQNYLREVQTKFGFLEEKAAKATENFNKAKAYYDDLVIKIETLSKSVENADYDKVKELQHAKNNFYQMIDKLDKEMVRISTQLNMVANEYNSLSKNAIAARNNFDNYRAKFAQKKAAVEPEIAKLKTELAEESKKLDKKLFAKYNEKVENNIFPVFVKAAGSNCGRCRMGISASRLHDFETNGYIECENCGRFIFK